MNELPTEITENGIHYTLNGDYYLPDISIPDGGSYWKMGTDAAEVSEGKQADPVQSDDPEWVTPKSPGGNE